MILSPAQLAQPDRYKLLIGSIVPRPIALVSTISPDGHPNLAPFSFFAGVGSHPMTLLFCPANTEQGGEKDSLRNAKPVSEGGTGEFVVNIVSVAIAEQMAACAEPLPYGESEFDLSGFSPAPCQAVKPSRVAECLISFECKTTQVIRTNPGQPAGGNIVIGEVVRVHVRDDIINERHHIDAAKLDAIGRMGGPGAYCTTREKIEIPPGKAALRKS
ncbi:MAG: flavin reductase family protein [Phycisphaerales bacterium]|jgi:flavin reductase (DIM6/NTAB) family NADH-FMN oxidoreductase RutF